jgi:protein tyrosine phosphatase
MPVSTYINEAGVDVIGATNTRYRVVKQFYFTAWPESGAPSTGAGMIDLIDQVIRTQQHTGDKPIVVHCR